MNTPNSPDIFNQIHIDVARNATDDFNLFHDSKKWSHINNNPFNGTIVLGFQLESLIEHKVLLYRQLHNENALIIEKNCVLVTTSFLLSMQSNQGNRYRSI